MSQELLQYRNAQLYWLDQKLSEKTAGLPTPTYLYSRKILQRRIEIFKKAFPKARIHYAVKANYFSGILQEFLKAGFHVDVVSWGEAQRALDHGFKPEQILFSGMGKTRWEIEQAVKHQIFQINVESSDELDKIIQTGKPARIALRWTPGLDVKTHKFINTSHADTKFGISREEILQLVSKIQSQPQIQFQGLSLHLGSQLLSVDDFKAAFVTLQDFLKEIKVPMATLDLGGGLGIDYRSSDIAKDEALLEEYRKMIEELWPQAPLQILFEPGRFLVARAGGILTEVQAVKKTKNKTFVVVDAGMNNLIRPALYEAHHGVMTLSESDSKMKVDVVGPICESSDYLALEREISEVKVGDRLWIADSGAYGSSMMSDYNLRPRAGEFFIEDL